MPETILAITPGGLVRERACGPTAPRSCEFGFSLVEVVIAMFVLGAMALALLPMLVNATKLGTENRSLLSATSLANELLTDARREGANGCAALTTWAGRSDLAPSTSGFTAVATATCPANRPGGGKVSIKIQPVGDTSRTLAELTTKVLVNP